MKVTERFNVVEDDGTIHEINKWEAAPISTDDLEDSGSSLESSPIYRTASGKAVKVLADGLFALRGGKIARRVTPPDAEYDPSQNRRKRDRRKPE
jgi:hypothetical protein